MVDGVRGREQSAERAWSLPKRPSAVLGSAMLGAGLLSCSPGPDAESYREVAPAAPPTSASSSLDAAATGDGAARSNAATDALAFAPGPDGSDASGFNTPPRLSELVESFFVPTCVLGRCHTTLAPAGGLTLTGRGQSVHSALVNRPSLAVSDRFLVVPHDPDGSYLIEKLTSEVPSVGTRMPPSSAVVSATQIRALRAWILAGAPDN